VFPVSEENRPELSISRCHIPVISREFPSGTGDFPAGSYRKLLKTAAGIINLGRKKTKILIVNN
jgi:hypothetical protein